MAGDKASTARPKRFYDTKPKAGAEPAAPKRGEGTSRARRTATDPRRKADAPRPGELVDRPTARRPAKPGAAKPRPPRTRK